MSKSFDGVKFAIDPPLHLFISWKEDVIQIKKLFVDRKYRRCAARCNELLSLAKHPIHKTFLYFYQALCYESLGHIAHNYSRNKIPLLEQARDTFTAASSALPLPFITAEDGQYASPGISPGCPTFDILPHYQDFTNSYDLTLQIASEDDHNRAPSNSGGGIDSSQSDEEVSIASKKRKLHAGAQGGANLVFETPQNKQSQNVKAPDSGTFRTHKTRLSESLSCEHILADDLVPSPLFSKKLRSKKEQTLDSISQAQYSSTPTRGPDKSLPVTPINRPLPTLPFNHQPQFEVRSGRHNLVPKRRTALSTLISRFEGGLPLIATPESSPGFTPRYQRISAAFTPHALTEEVCDVHDEVTYDVFDTSRFQENTDTSRAFLTSRSLARYNALLSSFRTRLAQHLTSVNELIHEVERAQHEHHVAKATRGMAGGSRLASFWSFKVAEDTMAKQKKGTEKQVVRGCAGGQAKAERIARLKTGGWQGVRKENHGWKGEAHYEELRFKVEMELGGQA